MSFPDLAWIETVRGLEVEAIDGGRTISEFTLAPDEVQNEEEQPVLGRAVDDEEETEERFRAVPQYLDYARTAFQQRGLVYPFQVSSSGDSLEVAPGQKDVARRSAELSRMVGVGGATAKQFEKTAFRTLHSFVGGWGTCIGAPREDGRGPEHAIRRLRSLLTPWEVGAAWPTEFAANGDNGADGFLILGRSWGGPIIFFQSKNTSFDIHKYPEEFGRMPDVFNDWFGKRVPQHRSVLAVLAMNTVLTMEMKERIFEARGAVGVSLVDAVDILCFEFTVHGQGLRNVECLIF